MATAHDNFSRQCTRQQEPSAMTVSCPRQQRNASAQADTIVRISQLLAQQGLLPKAGWNVSKLLRAETSPAIALKVVTSACPTLAQLSSILRSKRVTRITANYLAPPELLPMARLSPHWDTCLTSLRLCDPGMLAAALPLPRALTSLHLYFNDAAELAPLAQSPPLGLQHLLLAGECQPELLLWRLPQRLQSLILHNVQLPRAELRVPASLKSLELSSCELQLGLRVLHDGGGDGDNYISGNCDGSGGDGDGGIPPVGLVNFALRSPNFRGKGGKVPFHTPPTVTSLAISSHTRAPLSCMRSALPPGLVRLELHSLGDNRPLDALLPTLEVLHVLDDEFDCALGELPPALRELRLSRRGAFNQPLGVLPPGLKRLEVGSAFEQELGEMPPSLTDVRVGSSAAGARPRSQRPQRLSCR